jgi:hypothetical protein
MMPARTIGKTMSSCVKFSRFFSCAALKNLRFHSDIRTSQETPATWKKTTAATRSQDFQAWRDAKYGRVRAHAVRSVDGCEGAAAMEDREYRFRGASAMRMS